VYGIPNIPLLFVGVNDNDVLGSKARLAELLFDDLHKALSEIKKGNYRLEKRTMFCVYIKQKNNDNRKEVFFRNNQKCHPLQSLLPCLDPCLNRKHQQIQLLSKFHWEKSLVFLNEHIFQTSKYNTFSSKPIEVLMDIKYKQPVKQL
jgi:NAD kinase